MKKKYLFLPHLNGEGKYVMVKTLVELLPNKVYGRQLCVHLTKNANGTNIGGYTLTDVESGGAVGVGYDKESTIKKNVAFLRGIGKDGFFDAIKNATQILNKNKA